MKCPVHLPGSSVFLALGTMFFFVLAPAAPPPSVTLVTPNAGSTAGGTDVTIGGADFVEGMALRVYFGSVPSTAYSFVSSTAIQAYTPPHAAGPVDVSVTNPDNQSGTLPAGFTYTGSGSGPSVSQVSPNAGPISGGTLVGILGAGFTGATAVTFGDTAAASFAVVSDSSITATSPPHAAGTVHVTVTTPSGTSPTTTADRFTFGSGSCTLTCAATVPTGGTVDQSVNFQATATPSGCTGSPAFAWTFGDGQGSAAQNPSHTYALAGTFAWTVTASADGVTCQKTGSIVISSGGGCTLTCTATGPGTGTVNQPASFQATATPSGCTGSSVFAWTFGDGQGSAAQNPSHTYTSAGTFTWTMTVSVDGVTCQKTGSMAISGGGGCTLTCTAAAPASAAPNVTASFQSTATGTGCGGSPQFAWTFGDGQSSTEQNPTHSYTTAGIYAWTLTVSQEGQYCQHYGSIRVTDPPVISFVKKLTDPFRLKVLGSNFHEGCKIKVDGQAVPQTSYKSAGKVIAMKGAALKALCPKGQTVAITVTNNDDGSVSAPFSFTR